MAAPELDLDAPEVIYCSALMSSVDCGLWS